MSTSATTVQDEKLKSLGLSKMIVNKEQVGSYSRGLGAVSEKNPILVLLHGYPQSTYMWRHLIPLLPKDSPIFAPDLPGYGISAPIEKNDKLSVGTVLIHALKTEAKRTSSGPPPSPLPVILIGHDRGARVAHRLGISGAEGIHILGICMIDILPAVTQWSAPRTAPSMPIVGFFHWPFLANVDLANRVIAAFGGDNWCREMIFRWAGKHPAGLSSLQSDNAIDVYAEFFTNPSVVDASNKDYEAGASTDVVADTEDREKGRLVSVPVLLLYSETFLGKRFGGLGEEYRMPRVWEEWVEKGVDVQCHGYEEGIGHFGAEEAPEETARVLNEWLGRR